MGRPKSKERSVVIKVHIPKSWMKKLEEISKETGLCYSEIGRVAIKKFIENPKLV